MYEALSYVWGSHEDPFSIYVETSDGVKSAISITQNLAAALSQLRRPDESRLLWVDALCINQEHDGERQSQVERMTDIYRYAAKVIVWLGSEAEDSPRAMKLLTELGSTGDSGKIQRYSEAELRSIHSVLDRRWFERIWIRQEVRLAREVSMTCGSSTISGGLFKASITILRDAREFLVKGASMFDLLQHGRRCKCTDPRDRIYGMLGLLVAQEKDVLDIKPDYSLELGGVYERLVIQHVEKLRSLELLTSGSPHHPPTSAWPSWVPDWSQTQVTAFINDISMADAGTKAQATCVPPGSLHAMGTKFSQVSEVSEIGIPSDFDGTEAELDTELVMKLRLAVQNPDARYVIGGTRLEAYCSALTGGALSDNFVPPESGYPSRSESVAALSQILDKKSSLAQILSDPVLRDSLRVLRYYVRERSVFVTSNGYLGLGPASIQPGDHVCILLGCSQPLALRPAGTESFLLVGSCCVEGIMAGEALLGPLPENYRRVSVHDQADKALYHQFCDVSTGEICSIDPRVEVVLDGEEIDCLLDENQDLSPSEQGSVAACRVMEKRGTTLQEFVLV